MGSTAVHRKPPPSVLGWGQSLGPRWQNRVPGLLDVRQASCWSEAPGSRPGPAPSLWAHLPVCGVGTVGATSQGRLGMGPSPWHVHILFFLEFQGPYTLCVKGPSAQMETCCPYCDQAVGVCLPRGSEQSVWVPRAGEGPESDRKMSRSTVDWAEGQELFPESFIHPVFVERLLDTLNKKGVVGSPSRFLAGKPDH